MTTKQTPTETTDDPVAAAEAARLAGIEKLRAARAEQAEIHQRADQDRRAVDERVGALEREFAEAEAAEQRERLLAAARERYAAAVAARRPVIEKADELHNALVADPAQASASSFRSFHEAELARVGADTAVRSAAQALAHLGERTIPPNVPEPRLSRFAQGDVLGLIAAAAAAQWPRNETLRHVRPGAPLMGVRFG